MKPSRINNRLRARGELFVRSLFCVLFGFAVLSPPMKLNADQNYSRLGTQWRVYEQGWTGVWTRRINSNTFDARWDSPGQPEIQGVVEMKLDDRSVRMNRTDLYTNQRCEYRGEISKDGHTANGWLSCNNGPRVNWSAEISQGEPLGQRNEEVLNPPGGFSPRSEGPIVPKYNLSYRNWRYDLTGVWRGNDGGTYYVRQIGNNVWWYGEASNGQWSNIFHGALDGDWLEGFWLDVPKGRDRDNGGLRLRLISQSEFRREQKTGDDFGGSRWTRIR